MKNPIFEKLADSIAEGNWFQQSLAVLALERLSEIEHDRPINIAIVGDRTIKDVRPVMTHLVSFLKYFEDPEYYQVFTGDRDGVESIVRKACEVNKISVKTVSQVDGKYTEVDRKDAEKETNDQLVELCDVMLVITGGSDKSTVSMYNKARSAGRLVSKRIVGAKKK